MTYLALDEPPDGAAAGSVRFEDVDDQLGHPIEVVDAEATRREGGGADPHTRGVPRTVGVPGDGVPVGDDAAVEQGGFGLAAGEPERRDVEQRQVVLGPTGDEPDPASGQALGQRHGVVGDGLGVVLERRLTGLGQRDRLGRHHMTERSAQHHRAAAIDRFGELGLAQHHAAAWAAQRLVGGRGGDVSVRHRVEVAGEDLAGHEPGEVRHVDQQHGPDLVGDLAHRGEVDLAGIGGVAGDQHQGLELASGGGHGVVVEQLGLGVGAVRRLVEHLAADVRAEPVGEVAAGVERHAEGALIAERSAQLLPVGVAEVVDVLDTVFGQGGGLDPLRQNRPEGNEVGVDARVRLHVGVGRAEQGLGVVRRGLLDGVDVLATGVEPVTDGAFGVLVGHPGAHRQQRGGRRVVLAGDQLERLALVVQLRSDGGGDRRFDRADHLQRGPIGGAGGGAVERHRCRRGRG